MGGGVSTYHYILSPHNGGEAISSTKPRDSLVYRPPPPPPPYQDDAEFGVKPEGMSALLWKARSPHQPEHVPRLQYDDAYTYVSKVKARFTANPKTYKSFMRNLSRYKDGDLVTGQLVSRVEQLFDGHEDLMAEFGNFLYPGTSKEGTIPMAMAVMPSDEQIAALDGVTLDQVVEADAVATQPQSQRRSISPEPQMVVQGPKSAKERLRAKIENKISTTIAMAQNEIAFEKRGEVAESARLREAAEEAKKRAPQEEERKRVEADRIMAELLAEEERAAREAAAGEKKKKKKKSKKAIEVEQGGGVTSVKEHPQGEEEEDEGSVGALSECLLCFDGVKEWAAVPCGHLALCHFCADDFFFRRRNRGPFLDHCPTCQTSLVIPFLLTQQLLSTFKIYEAPSSAV